MIYALQAPRVLLGMILGLVALAVARSAVLAVVLRAPGGASLAARRWQRWFDPFGAVAIVIVGFGWLGSAQRRDAIKTLVVDLLVSFGISAVSFAGFAVAIGDRRTLGYIDLATAIHGGYSGGSLSVAVPLGAGAITLACGLLSLVPIPPLPIGVWLWSTVPKTPGARRLAYRLLEESWGVAALLVLLIIPIVNGESVLLSLVNTVGDALLGLAK